MTGPRRLLVRLAALSLVAVSLTACGGEDGEGLLPTPTRTPSISPTRSITATPTRTPRPTVTPSEAPSETPTETPTETPSEAPSETPSEAPSESPTPKPTKTPKPTETITVTETPSEEPSPTESATPTESPTESATPTEAPSETPDAEEVETEPEEDPAPAWVWWLLGLVLLAAAIGIPLYLWSKRRRQWRGELAAQEAEVVWLARTHLPGLRQKADTPDRVATVWDVGGEGRASATEDHLTALEASAPDDAAGARARTLRDGVRAARLRLAGLEGATTAEAVAAILDASIADLESALGSATGPAAQPS